MDQHLVVLGYMGSGKSSLGLQIAEQLGRPFVDLDEQIELHLGESISSFMEKRGELAFRKAEHEVLLDTFDKLDAPAVIALGGGTPVFFDHMEYLNDRAITLFLDVSIGELAKRLEKSVNRPLIQNRNDLQEFIAKHLFERRAFYLKATHRVRSDAATPEEVLAVLGVGSQNPS